MSVIIVPIDTIRDNDGLAQSSRNMYLSSKEREEALKIPASLYEATKMVSKGTLDVEEIKSRMFGILSPLKIAYVEILNRDFEIIKEIEIKNTIILVEAISGNTRLLDNIWI